MARAAFVLAFLVLLIGCDGGGDDNSEGNGTGTPATGASLLGTWDIVGTLVTSSSEDPTNPLAPKPGQKMTDSWTISKGAAGLDLTTPKGTVPGEAVTGGAHFYVSFEWEAGVWITVTIDCVQSSATRMVGTEEIVYTGTNVVTGEPIPLGREAWTFEGSKR